eukprot:TRINITY_DN13246_c0_g1_i1.p1 TRINITY_DN13246_c0_g1~~TRINITY_DN13246_c0_g1_i1.p1  ORF type:complete len:352 (-),score=71.48 TRINITY_DN13246_c0_g1_i1:146-1126(-)
MCIRDRKYIHQMERRHQFDRIWLHLIKFVKNLCDLYKFYQIKRETYLKQAAATFMISRVYTKYRARRNVKGRTWELRLLNDVKMAMGSYCGVLHQNRKVKAKRIVGEMCAMFFRAQFLLMKFYAYHMRSLRIQRRWKQYKLKKEAYKELLALLFEKYFYDLFLEYKKADNTADHSKEKPKSDHRQPRDRHPKKGEARKSLRMSFIGDGRLRDRVVDEYFSIVRRRYQEKMMVYRNTILSMRRERRRKIEYTKFFVPRLDASPTDLPWVRTNSFRFKVDHKRLESMPSQPEILAEENIKPPRMFVLPFKQEFKELIVSALTASKRSL